MNITQSIVGERERALLGGDYANYHAQATRRIHALRKRLGTATPRGRKFTPKLSVTAANVAQNAQWTQLLLASSERAWADAMAMKTAQSPENTQKPMAGSTKRQIVSRHKRAIAFAANLVEVLSDPVSKSNPADVLEAKAYLALLRGGLDFEKSRWLSCIQNYSLSRLIYTALDGTNKTDIYKEILSSTVDPSIKYAAYQSKFPRTKPVNDIAIENFPSGETSTKSDIQKVDPNAFTSTSDKAASAQSDAPSNLPTSIDWRSRKVKIEDGSVSQALGVSQDKELQLHDVFQSFSKGDTGLKELETAYEDVIDARQEAVDVTKTAIDELRSQGVEQGDARIQSLQVTRTAVNYAVIEWRVGRNRILCGKDDGITFESEQVEQNLKPRKDGKSRVPKEEGAGRKLARLRERVALYDSVLQSLDAIKELPGVVADTELVKEVDSKKAYFRALKCLAIGRSYALNGNILNALALFAKASESVQQASNAPGSVKSSSNEAIKLEVTPNQLKTAQNYLSRLSVQYRALVELQNLETSKKSPEGSANPPLIEKFHLNQYNDDLDPKNLVNYPPKLQAIPVKPLFFDLAWNYIRYPGETLSVTEPMAPEQPHASKLEDKPAKKGWFGFGR